jgi:hypothetical protein
MPTQEVTPKSTFEGGYIGFIIVTIVLLIAVIYLIYSLVNVTTRFIDPVNCPKIRGAFGSSPNTRGTTINLCGTNSISPCTTRALTLNDATVYCEANASICDAFSFSYSLGQVDIIDSSVTPVETDGFDTYFRQ